jgi:hypothetical protein
MTVIAVLFVCHGLSARLNKRQVSCTNAFFLKQDICLAENK